MRRRIHCEKEDTFSAFAVFNDTVEGPRAQEMCRMRRMHREEEDTL